MEDLQGTADVMSDFVAAAKPPKKAGKSVDYAVKGLNAGKIQGYNCTAREDVQKVYDESSERKAALAAISVLMDGSGDRADGVLGETLDGVIERAIKLASTRAAVEGLASRWGRLSRALGQNRFAIRLARRAVLLARWPGPPRLVEKY